MTFATIGFTACDNARTTASEREQVVFNFYIVSLMSTTREEIYFGTQIISSVLELKNFAHDNQVNFKFFHNSDFSSSNFASIFVRYYAGFFENNILVVYGAVTNLTHGFRYRLAQNYLSDNVMNIEIERYSVGQFAAQAFQHFIFLVEICTQDTIVNDVNIVVIEPN